MSSALGLDRKVAADSGFFSTYLWGLLEPIEIDF
jgi:hypothetical protein